MQPSELNGLTAAALLASPLLAWCGWYFGGRRLHTLLAARLREPIVSDSPQLAALHAAKGATPTMGGLGLFGAWLLGLLPAISWADGPLLGLALLALSLAGLGAWDDLLKIRRRRGLSRHGKLGLQFLLTAPWVLVFALADHAGWQEFAVRGLLVWLAVVGCSNAVNLTDGLDGLAAGCSLPCAAALALLALAAGHFSAALAALSLCGSLLGFLAWNRHPAKLFMGDTGSLALGGVLAGLAATLRLEWLLLVVGGVFVVETLSVMLQIAGFRMTGKRIFRCAPLHHHFEFLGWSEPTIVRRFQRASAACAAAGLLWMLPLPHAEIAVSRTARAGEAETAQAARNDADLLRAVATPPPTVELASGAESESAAKFASPPTPRESRR